MSQNHSHSRAMWTFGIWETSPSGKINPHILCKLELQVFFLIFKLMFLLSFKTNLGRTSLWFETWIISSWLKLGVNVMYMSFEVTSLDFHEDKTLILFFSFCFKWHRTSQNIWLLNWPLPVSLWISHPWHWTVSHRSQPWSDCFPGCNAEWAPGAMALTRETWCGFYVFT